MPGNTPLYGWPYPTGVDRVVDGDNAIMNLALAVEATVTETAWVLPALSAGWTTGAGQVAYHRDRAGVVHIEGVAAAGGVPPSSQLFVLPVGFRPNTVIPIVGFNIAIAGGPMCQGSVLASGEVNMTGATQPSGNTIPMCVSFSTKGR